MYDTWKMGCWSLTEAFESRECTHEHTVKVGLQCNLYSVFIYMFSQLIMASVRSKLLFYHLLYFLNVSTIFLDISTLFQARIISYSHFCEIYHTLLTFKYHVSCTDGKISVRIDLLFYLFFHRHPIQVVFLSCRPFVVNTTFSTGLVDRPTGKKHTTVG